jgi:hypothetical protein
MNSPNNGWRQGNDGLCIGMLRALPPEVGLEGWRTPEQVKQVPGGGLGVLGGHDSADDCDAVQFLLLGCTLIDDTLQVGLVDAADADGLCVITCLGDLFQDAPDSGCADDLLGVCLSKPASVSSRPRITESAHVGVA